MASVVHLSGRAPAKINLGLKILGRRPDGFHDLRTVFQTLALADTVSIVLSPGSGIDLELAPCEPLCSTPAGRDNLVLRAAELARDAFRLRRHLRIRLTKRIPVGSGLGGGSSDAACVLRLLAAAATSPPPPALLARLAATLGSDVTPFLVAGTTVGLGRGEEVYPLPDLGAWYCVLVMPGIRSRHSLSQISTAAAFAQWDRLHPGLTPAASSVTLLEFSTSVRQVLPAFRLGRNRDADSQSRKRARASKVHAGIENDFQSVVFSLSPDFPRIHRQLRHAGAAWVSLTGSGAAQFGLFASRLQAARAVRWFEGRDRVWLTRFLGRAAASRG